MKDFNSNSSSENGTNYHFHEKEYLVDAFETANFDILLYTNQEFEENDYEYTDLILIESKNNQT